MSYVSTSVPPSASRIFPSMNSSGQGGTVDSAEYKSIRSSPIPYQSFTSPPSSTINPLGTIRPRDTSVNMVRALILLVVLAVVACMVSAGEYDGAEAYPAVAERRGGLSFGGFGGSGYGAGWGGWRPKFRYINFRIPVPILPRISIGLKQGGWGGWRSSSAW